MPNASYIARRDHLENYFDRTAAAWAAMTSDVPLTGIRASVRAGRDRMRATFLTWLPADLQGARVFDAGCGTGALAFEAARLGADVVGVDLSPRLIALAKERMPPELQNRITLAAGDMIQVPEGPFDFCVAMDSLVHYPAPDLVAALGQFASLTRVKILFTFAPKTLLLSAMHTAGKLFPRSNRAPEIEPVAEAALRRKIAAEARLAGWREGRSVRIVNGFYTSQAMELAAK